MNNPENSSKNIPSQEECNHMDEVPQKFEMFNLNSSGKLCECCCMLPKINKHTTNGQCLGHIIEKLTKNSQNSANNKKNESVDIGCLCALKQSYAPNISLSNNSLPVMVEACTCCGPDAEKQSFKQQTIEIKISTKLKCCKCDLEGISYQQKPACCELISSSSLPIMANRATSCSTQFNKECDTNYKKGAKLSFSDKTDDTIIFATSQGSIVSESQSCPNVNSIKNKQECCKCSVRPNGDLILQQSSPMQYKLRECSCIDDYDKMNEIKTPKTPIDASVETKRLCLCKQVAGSIFCVPDSSTSLPVVSTNTKQYSDAPKNCMCCIGTNTGENGGSTDSGISTKRCNIPSINLKQSANIESRPTQNANERNTICQLNIAKPPQCQGILLKQLQRCRNMGSDLNVLWMNILYPKGSIRKLGGLFGGNPNQCPCPPGQCKGNCAKFQAQPQNQMANAPMGPVFCGCAMPDIRQNVPQQVCVTLPTCAPGSVPPNIPPAMQETIPEDVPEMPESAAASNPPTMSETARESIVSGSVAGTVPGSVQENVQQQPTTNCTCSENTTCKPKCQERKLAARQYSQNMEGMSQQASARTSQQPQMIGQLSCGPQQQSAYASQQPGPRPCVLPCQEDAMLMNQQMPIVGGQQQGITQNIVQQQCACSQPAFPPGCKEQIMQYPNNNVDNNFNVQMQNQMSAPQPTEFNCVCPPACMPGAMPNNSMARNLPMPIDKSQNKDLCICAPDNPNVGSPPTGTICVNGSEQQNVMQQYGPNAPAYNSYVPGTNQPQNGMAYGADSSRICPLYSNVPQSAQPGQQPAQGPFQQSMQGNVALSGQQQFPPPYQQPMQNPLQQPNLSSSAVPSAQINENSPQCKCSGIKCIKSVCEMKKRDLMGNNGRSSAVPSVQQGSTMGSQLQGTMPGTQQGAVMGSQLQSTIPCSRTAPQPGTMPGTQQGYVMNSQLQSTIPCPIASQPGTMPETQQGYVMGSQLQSTIPCPLASPQPGMMPGTQQGYVTGSQLQSTIPCPLAAPQPGMMPGTQQGYVMGSQLQTTIPCPLATPQAEIMQGTQEGSVRISQLQNDAAVSGSTECHINEELKSILKGPHPLKCKCVGPCNVQCDRIKELRKELLASDANVNSVVGSNANPKDFGTQIDPKIKSNCTCNTIECKRA